ncbi:hypothetical protein [Streptomyces sp. NPDC015131]|uniref:hypothetical protein n=1 Tax=Streptomyces sp. NPDC015131 TaxID=3364941 RepID=UPI0036F4DF19
MTETTTTRKRPGRKPSALKAAANRFEEAKAKADKARAAHAKVEHIVETLETAETEEQQALEDLQNTIAELAGDDTDSVADYDE